MSGFFWPIVLLVVSIALLFLETLLPSAGVLGVLACFTLGAAIISAFTNVGMQGGTAFLLGCVALAPIVFVALVRLWPKTPIGKRILPDPLQEAQVIPERRKARQEMMGRIGLTVSTMIPSGAVRIEGRVVDAVSEGVTIEKGTPVEVIDVKGNHFVVRPTAKPVTASENRTDKEVLDQPVDMIMPDPFDD